MTATLQTIQDDYELLEADERYRLLIDLGRALEPMPEALKTDATLVRGCPPRSGFIQRVPGAVRSISSPTAMPRSQKALSRWCC